MTRLFLAFMSVVAFVGVVASGGVATAEDVGSVLVETIPPHLGSLPDVQIGRAHV